MPTQLFRQLPWVGGLNTNSDPSMVGQNQLTRADNIIMGTRPSKRKREGINHYWNAASISSGTVKILKLHEFWYGTSSSKTQKLVGIGDDKAFRAYTLADGTVTAITDAGTAWSGTISEVYSTTFNNRIIIGCDGSTSNVLKKWTGSGNVEDLDGTPPAASFMQEFQGRLFTNDKTNLDRVHFSPVHDHTLWNGNGDSGALDIGVGDGDPSGITAIFPTFKGDLFISKRTKLYRLITQGSNDPADWIVINVSKGIGCVGHNSVCPIEQDDIVFVSDRGVHSLVAVQNFGDFESTFLSADIQKTFNEGLARSRFSKIQCAYDPTINTIAFTVTESPLSVTDTDSSKNLYGSGAPVTTSLNNALYLYNISRKEWYRWPGISAQSIVTVRDSTDSKVRWFLGTHITRISKTKMGTNYDTSHANAQIAIPVRLTTGYIFPNTDPTSPCAFKDLILYYTSDGTHTITANFYVDNQTLDTDSNSRTFNETTGGDLLGSTFILGTSVYGGVSPMKPYTKGVDGVGRSFQLDLTNNGVNEMFEIYGFGTYFEPLSPLAEID